MNLILKSAISPMNLNISSTLVPMSLKLSLARQGVAGDKGDKGDTGDAGLNGINGIDGIGVKSVELVSGNHASGTYDTYRITYTDDTTFDYSIYNGKDGTNGIDGQKGDKGDNGISQISTDTDSLITGIVKGYNGKLAQAVSGIDYISPDEFGRVIISRNIADTISAFVVNQVNASSTGFISTFQFGGSNKVTIDKGGNIGATSIYNSSNANNSTVTVGPNGANVSRNIADSNSAFIVNQVNASSTGNVQEWQFGGVQKANLSTSGTLTLSGAVVLGSNNSVYASQGSGLKGASAANGSFYVGGTTAGAQVFRDLADAYATLTINNNNASSIGNIQEWQFGGITKARIGTPSGRYYGAGVSNYTTIANSLISLDDTGTVISRNIGDSNTALTVNQVNASSTGNIMSLQYQGYNKVQVGTNGDVYLRSVKANYGAAYGTINMPMDDQNTPISITRNVADAYPVAVINQINASSTGNIIEFQSAGTKKAHISQYGEFYGYGVVPIGGQSLGALTTGTSTTSTKIQRSTADGYSAFVINNANASSTGYIVEFQNQGTRKSQINYDGSLYVPYVITGSNGMCYSTVSNASVYAGQNGTVITRNIADDKSALTINQQNASSTGRILDLQFGGVSKAYVSASGSIAINGNYYGSALAHPSTSAYGLVSMGDLSNTTTISRDRADTVSALNVNLINSGSTAFIQTLQFQGSNKAAIDRAGYYWGSGFGALSNTNHGTLTMGNASSATTISRNMGDSYPVFVVNNTSTTSTGNLQEWKVNGSTKAFIMPDGAFVTGGWVVTGGGTIQIQTPITPASSASAGSTGQIGWDDNYLYVRTSVGWKRTAQLSTF